MRTVNTKTITENVRRLSIKANVELRSDVLSALRSAYRKEKNSVSGRILEILIKNAEIAKRERIAICQDTGLPEVFVEVGQDVKIKGGSLTRAINKGIEKGYREGFFRASIVNDPIKRGRSGYGPAVIHYDIVAGRRIKITIAPKGFGSENKSKIIMLRPTAQIDEIAGSVVDAVRQAGPDACPPYIIGVGIGGTLDKACILAKKALLAPINKRNTNLAAAKLERLILNKINDLRIGPMGLGGRTTALGVKIALYPTHIAGLPVSVNISCHALRSAAISI